MTTGPITSLSQRQRLTDDIIWRVAKVFLDNPKDVLHLASTCRTLWFQLENEVYRTDILVVEALLAEKTSGAHWFEEHMQNVAGTWDGPMTPDGGAFPDEDGRLYGAYGEWWRDPDLYDDDSEPLTSPTDRLPSRSTLSVLHWAAIEGLLEKVDKVGRVAARVFPPYLDFQNHQTLHAAVHFAALYGYTDVLEALERNGCDMNSVSGYKCMPIRAVSDAFLHINPRLGYIPPGFTLLDPKRPFALNALGLAILRGHEESAKYLVQYYDDDKVDTNDDDDDDNYDDNDNSDDDAEVKTLEFQPIIPPLHLAAYMGQHDIVKILLKRGAAVNAGCRQIQQSTPLMWAVTRPDNDGIMKMLQDGGADISIRDAQGRSALEWALQWKAPQNACRLVELGLPINRWVHSANTCCALSLSMQDDINWECTELMLNKYPDMEPSFLRLCVQDSLFDNSDCPHGGNRGKNIETLRWFIENDIGLGVVEEEDFVRNAAHPERHLVGRSSLHAAIWLQVLPLDILTTLLKKRPHDINLVESNGYTPAALALAHNHHSEIVRLLIKHGAEPEACTQPRDRIILSALKEGKTAAEVDVIAFEIEKKLEEDRRQEQERRKRRTHFLQATSYNWTQEEGQALWKNRIDIHIANQLRDNFGYSTAEILSLSDRGIQPCDELRRLI